MLPRATTKKWLRALSTDPGFAYEIGMPWEISLQTLDSGRNVKLYDKAGGIGAFQTRMSIVRDLSYSVSPLQISSDPTFRLSHSPQVPLALGSVLKQAFYLLQSLSEQS